jgi:hypothetical protein
MTARCLLCPEDAAERHHLSGKPPASLGGSKRKHLDPSLVVAVCDDCHDLLHEDLRSQDLDTPLGHTTWTVLDRIEFGLARVGCFFGRLAETQQWGWCNNLADTLCAWADQLGGLRHALDEHYPDWAGRICGATP